MIKFHYYGLTGLARTNVVTVASHYDRESKTLTLGYALSNKNDVYSKKYGKELALARLKDGPNETILVDMPGPFKYSDFHYAIGMLMCKLPELPKWVSEEITYDLVYRAATS